MCEPFRIFDVIRCKSALSRSGSNRLITLLLLKYQNEISKIQAEKPPNVRLADFFFMEILRFYGKG
ncbi:hypothetical protein DLM77_01070 [Leptospira yasudae]|uniref:Uncharacterized protein n=1 Tax=Leptospira yasudae TaxID=2202201 RepID=A0ABX9M7M7_9LEPT|nr:hypothetical protein DLM77_01070 [Leptospira yasudae]